jgi:hypothetical protein
MIRLLTYKKNIKRTRQDSMAGNAGKKKDKKITKKKNTNQPPTDYSLKTKL